MKKTLLTIALASSGLLAGPVLAQDYPQQTDSTDTSMSQDTGMTADTGYDAGASGNYLPQQPVGSGNWFVGASVGRTSGSSHAGFGENLGDFNFFEGQRGRRTGYGAVGGYRWKAGQDLGLGFEGGYTDLGNFRLRNVFNSGAVNQRDTVNALHGWLAGVNARINLTPQWYVSTHGGVFWANDNNTRYYNTVAQDLGFSNGHKGDRASWYAGIGTGWDVDTHFSVGVAYDYFHANAGHVTNPDTGASITEPKRSTGIVSLAAEYRF